MLAFYILEKCIIRYIALTLSIYKNILLPDKSNFVQINVFVRVVIFHFYLVATKIFEIIHFILPTQSSTTNHAPLRKTTRFLVLLLIPFTPSLLKIYCLLINYFFFTYQCFCTRCNFCFNPVEF
jgi:hypothetical protein